MGGPKTAIVTQVVHFYFGAVGQYYFGANTRADLADFLRLDTQEQR